MSVSPSRRRLLQGALLSPLLAACTSEPETPRRVHPDVALRSAAVARERARVERYRAAAASSSSEIAARTAGLAEEHEEHLRSLGAPLSGATPAATPSPGPVPTLAQLVAAERAASAGHAAAALHASRPLAAVLASLAASEASHVVVLA
jgi:hypothetical protein